MSLNKEFFEPAAILATIVTRTEGSGEISAESKIEVFDMLYDCLLHYAREKNPRESFRITR